MAMAKYKLKQKVLWNPFWAGYLFACCVVSFTQDLVGKEKWIQLLEKGWVDAIYTVPLAGVAFMVAVYWLVSGLLAFENCCEPFSSTGEDE